MPAPWFGSAAEAKLYDFVSVGGLLFTGKVDIDGAVTYKLDTKPSAGKDGAKHSYQGYLPAAITVGLQLHDEQSHKDFAALLKIILPKPGKTIPPPVDIVHPWLELYGLRAFLVPKVHLPRRVAPQLFEAKLECTEYFPAPKTAGQQAKVKLKDIATIWSGDGKLESPRPSKTGIKP